MPRGVSWDDRRDMIQDQINDFEALLELDILPRERINALTKLHAAQNRLVHLAIAEELERSDCPEHRARVSMVMATADGSHVAAGQASRELDRLVQDRLAREAAERERAILAASPTEALQTLAQQLLAAPQGDRSWLVAVLSSGRLPD